MEIDLENSQLVRQLAPDINRLIHVCLHPELALNSLEFSSSLCTISVSNSYDSAYSCI